MKVAKLEITLVLSLWNIYEIISKISEPKSVPVLVKQLVKYSKLKASKSGFTGNLINYVSRVSIFTESIQSYDEECLFCSKMEFEIFNKKGATEKYCALVLVSVEEIVNVRQSVEKRELRAQEMLNLSFFDDSMEIPNTSNNWYISVEISASQQAGSFIIKATLKFQILLLADSECFLLSLCQTIDTQSCFTLPRLAFRIDFSVTINKP